MFGSGQWTIWEGYAALKLMKAGFRSNNLDPNARHCMASAVQGFMRTFGMDEPMGCYDDIEAADAFVLWGSNMAEMHPVLWTRVTDRRMSAPKTTKVAVLSVFEHRCFDLADLPDHLPSADRSRDRELHRELHHPHQSRQPRFRRQAHGVQAGQHGHRLWPAPRARAAEGGEERVRRRRQQADDVRRVREVRCRATTQPTSPSSRAFRRRSSTRSPSCMRTRRSRSCRSGRWASTSTRAACGRTSSSTTCTC